MNGADEERLLRALALVERFEWSGSHLINENMHSAASYTTVADYCPVCGGSQFARRDFPQEKWGHREDCEVRKVLGRPAHYVENISDAVRINKEREHAEIMRTQREGPWREYREGKFRTETADGTA